jgi:predicted AlkP superfamily phosphohydrolase/phosphomutase
VTVLAIALDSAEATVVRKLADEGSMPAVAELLRRGAWRTVRSPVVVGSATVWPTFFSGAPPEEHGLYGEWVWDPDAMEMRRPVTDHVVPFWEDAALTVGALGIPLARHSELRGGWRLSGWGLHDRWGSDAGLGPTLSIDGKRAPTLPPHPFDAISTTPKSSTNRAGLQRLARACLAGAHARGDVAEELLRSSPPDLALVVFTEIHHASHHLWQTTWPEHPFYAGLEPGLKPDLLDIYRVVDDQVGRLAELARETIVFALHGMGPSRGIVGILNEVLESAGEAAIDRGPASTPARVLAAAKRRVPERVKERWYARAPRRLTEAVAHANLLPRLRWEETRAFAMTTDQHGRVQVNLRGREARGVVEPSEYEPLLARLEGLLLGLEDDDGQRLVGRVMRYGSPEGPTRAPDLIVHWADAAHLPGSDVTVHPELTGQHLSDGFCVLPEPLDDPGLPDVLEAGELAELFQRMAAR